MANAETNTPNPSNANRNAEWRDYQAIVHEMAGAASIAALVLGMARDDEDGSITSLGLKAGLSWLEAKLSAAAENLLAIYGGREPHWLTMGDVEGRQEALARAAAREAACPIRMAAE